MNRTEYLRIRFKQDLLKFVLLPESSAAADETADSLVGDMDISAFVEDQSRKIDAICARELSLDSLKVGGELPDDLPEGFGLELGDRMTAEYRTSLDEELACLRKEAVDRLLLGIESQCWRNGLSVMPGVMRLLGERLETLAVNYGDLCQSPVPDAELRGKYEDARKITLLERLRGDNLDDIMEYRNALIGHVRTECSNLLYRSVAEVCRSVASDPAIAALAGQFERSAAAAREIAASLPRPEPCAEWDREYERLVPVGFYNRNVRAITPARAFRMHILLALPNSEEMLREKGLLRDGELYLFTSGADSLLEIMENIETAGI